MLLIIILNVVTVIRCADILGVFIAPSISHQVVFQPIWRELSLRGHKVTVLTPNPINDPSLTNLTEIDLGFTYEIIRRNNLQASMKKDLPIRTIVKSIYKLMDEVIDAQLSHPSVQRLINDPTKHFDVMLVEFLHPTMTALSAKFNCPFIGITSLGAFLPGHDAVGNPSHPVLNPDILLPLMGQVGFYERLYSSFFVIWFRFYYAYNVLPRQDVVARKYISNTIPYLGDIEKNVSLLFLNVNPIIHPIRPNVPAIIELGKMHIVKHKPLPIDLQKELDQANQGVVYFSLGSNVRSANLSTAIRNEIIKALSELPYKVLWKWETDNLPDQPNNVVTRKWFPQQDLLGHKNIKVFVTQGGLQSMEEAISNVVPLVAMPFFGDQPLNVAKMVKLGIAKALDINTLTNDQLKSAIIEVAENDKYRKAVKKISDLTSDVPMTGLEKAVWWTEYVIRHKGAKHLRSPAVDLPWYQYLLLDVICFVLFVLVLSILAVYKIICYTLRTLKKVLVDNKVKIS